MQICALIALLRAVTLPFLASISAVFESRLARSLRAAVAIRAPICLTQTSEFLSLMNPLLTQMSGESASVEIQARARIPDASSRLVGGRYRFGMDLLDATRSRTFKCAICYYHFSGDALCVQLRHGCIRM